MRRLATLVALALLLTACGPKSHLELGMRSVNITAPRLITPAVELVPAAPLPLTFTEFEPIELPPVPKRPPPAPTCPEADAFAAPDAPASVIVASPPAAASFVQTSKGQYVDAAGKKTALDGIVATTVTPATTTTASNGQKADSWLVVHSDAAQQAVWAEAYQLVHPLAGVGGTNPGVWLVGLAWADARGKFVFQPTGNGVQLLPTPVVRAANDTQYIGAATDPTSLTTLQITRNVRDKALVDACGQVIDAYTVEITGVLTTTTDVRQVTWTQHWATAFGAADVEHTLSLTNPIDGSTYTRTLRNTALPKGVS
jgi:hypothetical protein